MVLSAMIAPRPCHTYYYGGLPIKGSRRKGRLWVEGNLLFFTVPKGKGGEEIDLKIPFPNIEKIALTRDNYYGSDTVLFNLSFRDQQGKSFTLRFAPIIIIPRRRIALQQQWFDFLTQAINAPAKAAHLSTR
ncbi:MAG: hypothetical protein A2Y65_07235 [Deltaproteobacteria bacterium RBG_13_52_11]|nr:MAG: hypothetical protein A2Y65_07235 [Deltaproteobacteria bacterium RBG_13_52_11]